MAVLKAIQALEDEETGDNPAVQSPTAQSPIARRPIAQGPGAGMGRRQIELRISIASFSQVVYAGLLALGARCRRLEEGHCVMKVRARAARNAWDGKGMHGRERAAQCGWDKAQGARHVGGREYREHTMQQGCTKD